tara:strand:+ start:1133 stop:2323 length:1191 start_codon:yes stop_codon:yes gene_type:complete
MKIGIDCQSIDLEYKGGINTYLFGLIEGLLKINSNHQLVVFVNKGKKDPFVKKLNSSKINVIELTNHSGLLRKIIVLIPFLFKSVYFWELFHNIYNNFFLVNKKIEKNCDILYSASTTINSYNLKVPTIVSMHDIQQYHFPEFFSKYELNLRNLNFVNTAKNVTFIQASSQFIKHDLLKHFSNLRKEQIVVINEGVNYEKFQQIYSSDILEKYNLPNRFLFYPAQLWEHKNHITILKALNEIKKNNDEIPLVLCGAKYSAFFQINEFIKKNKFKKIIYLGKVPEEDLLSLYQNASFLIVAALYESSSLPILEAAAAGLPIIAASTPPNVEYGSYFKINYFEPTNYKELSLLLKKLFSLNNDIHDEIKFNKNNIMNFTWSIQANKYIQFLESKIEIK